MTKSLFYLNLSPTWSEEEGKNSGLLKSSSFELSLLIVEIHKNLLNSTIESLNFHITSLNNKSLLQTKKDEIIFLIENWSINFHT